MELRSSKHLSLILSCFIFSAAYPVLVPFCALYTICLYFTEEYTLSSITFLRPKVDIYEDELIKPIFLLLNVGYLAKILVSTTIYAYVMGKAHVLVHSQGNASGASYVAAGLLQSWELALPFLA